MEIRIALEWSAESGISLNDTYSFRDKIEEYFSQKNYGSSVSTIWIILILRPYNFKQRKRYVSKALRVEYDILLDFFLIKNSNLEEKKRIIREQVIASSLETFSRYKFDDFDKNKFLSDLKSLVQNLEW